MAGLEPTGEANQPPLFVVRDVRITNRQRVGQDGKHLKCQLTDGSAVLEGIAFRWGEVEQELPEAVDVACHIELNEWNGRERLQLNIQDFRPTISE